MHQDTIIMIAIKRKRLKFLIEQALNLSLFLDLDQFLNMFLGLARFLNLFLDLDRFLDLSLDPFLEEQQVLKQVDVIQIT